MRSRRWLVFLVGGLVGTIAAGVSGSFVAAALAAQVFGWWGSLGAFSASRRLSGAAGKAWKFFGTAGLAFLIAGIVRTVHGMLIDVERPFPSPADVFVAIGQLALIFGGILLGHLRSPSRDRAAIIDGAIVAVGAATVTWALLLGPYMADSQYSIDERLINAASNLLLTVFLAAIVRLAFGPGARTVSYYLLACAVALIFIQDTLVTLEVVGGPNATIGRALAPAIYVFFGAAAMHPDRHLMTEPPRQFDVSLSWRRITLLVGALLIAPAMICLQLALGWDPNIVILTISSILASMLVLARLIFLVRDREQATVREQTLREASARFAVAPDREAAYGAAMEAVERLASGATALRVVLVAEGPEDLQILHVAGYRASEAVGCVRREGSPPRAGRRPRTARRRRPRRPAGGARRRRHAPAAARRPPRQPAGGADGPARRRPTTRCPPSRGGRSSPCRPRCRSPSRPPSCPRTCTGPGASAASGPWSRTRRTSCVVGRRRARHLLRQPGQPAPPRAGRGRADGAPTRRAPPRRGPPMLEATIDRPRPRSTSSTPSRSASATPTAPPLVRGHRPRPHRRRPRSTASSSTAARSATARTPSSSCSAARPGSGRSSRTSSDVVAIIDG